MLWQNYKGQGLATQNPVSLEELLGSGAHFGHQKHRWNPKMKRFIFEERGGIYIIDLAKTLQQIRKAVGVVKEVIGQHKSVLFVGTKKQAKSVVKEVAEECGEFYAAERWLGGMLTNLSTIRKSVKTLEKIEKQLVSGSGLTKKELSQLGKKQEKLNNNLAGIRAMRKPPGLLIVVDPSKEHIAVAEARKLGIPVMALVDTNCDPDPIDYVIACNDDALKSIKLVLGALGTAVLDQKAVMNIPVKKGEKKTEKTAEKAEDKNEDTEEKSEG